MELKIAEKKEAPLLYRTEITADITADAVTPSKEEVKKQCASSLKVDEKLIVVKEIKTSFGSKASKALIYTYKDEKKMESIEPKQKKEESKEAPKEEESK